MFRSLFFVFKKHWGRLDRHGRTCSGHDEAWAQTSAKRGERLSILARTASSWLAPPISFICSTDSASSAGPGSTDRLFSMRLAARIASGLLPAIFAGNLKGRGARVVADARGEAVAQSFLRRENPPGIGQLPQNIVADEARQDRRSRHIRHQPPFDFHDRHPRIGREKPQVGAERELKAAAERHALDRGNHWNRQLPPSPHRSLREIGQAMGADAQIAVFAARYPVTAHLLHRREAAHVEAGAKSPPLAG